MSNTEQKECKKCKELINKKAKKCPKCGSKQGMPIWLIVVIVFVLIGMFAGGESSEEDSTNTPKVEKNKSVKVTVTDFSTMTPADSDTWCETNKVNCTIKNEYSDTVKSGALVSQSVAAEKTIYEGDKLTIIYSLGKEPSIEYKNALKKAQSYCENLHMSKQGIYEQLTSEYGEDFEKDAARYAIDNLECDYKANALAKAKSYRDNMSMSKNAIYDQLISEYGEEFTKSEAKYAIDNLD